MSKYVYVCPKCSSVLCGSEGAEDNENLSCPVCGCLINSTHMTEEEYDKKQAVQESENITEENTEAENVNTDPEKSEGSTQNSDEEENRSKIGGVLKAIGWILLMAVIILAIPLCVDEKYITACVLLAAGIFGSCVTIGFGEIIKLLQDIKHRLEK